MTIAQGSLILVGIFTIAGGVFDWELLMAHWKSRLFVRLFGRNGARLFYVLLGLLIVGMGLWL